MGTLTELFSKKIKPAYYYIARIHHSSSSSSFLLYSQNDVLVLEDLTSVPGGGYRKYPRPHLSDLDHCRVVLRRLAHFHAISTLIQRDSEMSLTDIYPFAVEASAFQRKFWARMSR